MLYSIEDLEKDISEYITKTAALRKAKGHDYASEHDTFIDLRDPQLGCKYVAMRIKQKIGRVLNLLDKPPAVQDEKIEQEFEDIVNFSLYLPILWRQKNEQ